MSTMLELSKFADWDVIAAFTIFFGAIVWKGLSVYFDKEESTGSARD
jgi:hypothetical protein